MSETLAETAPHADPEADAAENPVGTGPAGDPPPEVVLDLDVPTALASKLLLLPPLAALRAGRARARSCHIVWCDTPDLALAASDRALGEYRTERDATTGTVWRLEASGRRLGEAWSLGWAPGTPPPLLASAETPAALDDAPQPLVPVATFEGQSRSLPLIPGCPLHEVTVTQGLLRAVTATRAVLRLRLGGPADAVFGLARTLVAEHGLAVAGNTLATEAQSLLARPEKVELPPASPSIPGWCRVEDAFAMVVAQLTAILLHHAPAARAGQSPAPVHQMRVALRRLRAALSLFRRATGGQATERVRDDLRVLARALGPARDWDVFTTGTGRAVRRALQADRAVARLLVAAERRRQACYAALAGVLDGPAFRLAVLDLIELATARPWRTEPVVDAADLAVYARRALDRRLRHVNGVADLADLDGAALHELRIQCKRLRYAAEFFAPLFPGRATRRFLRRVETVQERLGQMNDGRVAAALLAELGPAGRGFAAGAVHGWIAARSDGARSKAERSFRRFRRADRFWT